MCTPCGPMICYKYEEMPAAGAGRAAGSDNRAPNAESSSQNKGEKENQLRRIKSRELRGGIMYYSCHCIKRNGLQHDCRRTGCGGEPACLVLPDPLCAPSQLARARGLADPAPLQAHVHGTAPGSGTQPGSSSQAGKKFIVCELKAMTHQDAAGAGSASGQCCCSRDGGSGGKQQGAKGGAAPEMPVLVMKLC